MKMYGRLGWHGQCACCSGPRTKHSEKLSEERQWRSDFVTELVAETSEAECPATFAVNRLEKVSVTEQSFADSTE